MHIQKALLSRHLVVAIFLLLISAGCVALPVPQAMPVSAPAEATAAPSDAESSAAIGELPPGPTRVLLREWEIDDGAEEFRVVQRLLAFPPGVCAPPHFHGGHVMVSVLDGEWTNIMGEELDHITIYTAGEGVQEPPGQIHAPCNETDEMTHVFASFAMPPDVAITTVVEGLIEGDLPPGPDQLYVGTMEMAGVPEVFNFIQVVLDFPPGAWTPDHYHGGNGLTTVVAGEMTRRIGDVEETYGVGESWVEIAGEVHAAGNQSDEHSRIIVTFVLPTDATLTTVVE
jgi:quercetin dioxygenase-like cupin family protein